MPRGEEHDPRKTYRPGKQYRPRDPFFQRMADMEAQESAEAFVRAVYSSPTMPQAPTASTADLDMADKIGTKPWQKWTEEDLLYRHKFAEGVPHPFRYSPDEIEYVGQMLSCAPAVLAYPLNDAAFLSLIHVRGDL